MDVVNSKPDVYIPFNKIGKTKSSRFNDTLKNTLLDALFDVKDELLVTSDIHIR